MTTCCCQVYIGAIFHDERARRTPHRITHFDYFPYQGPTVVQADIAIAKVTPPMMLNFIDMTVPLPPHGYIPQPGNRLVSQKLVK